MVSSGETLKPSASTFSGGCGARLQVRRDLDCTWRGPSESEVGAEGVLNFLLVQYWPKRQIPSRTADRCIGQNLEKWGATPS